MAYSSHYEMKLDHSGGKFYASRNYNDMRHLYEKWGVDRSQVDWLLQLRQVRPVPEKQTSPEGAPSFGESRERPERTKGPEEGEYVQQKYGNTADSGHMLRVGDGVHTKTVRPIVKEQVHFQTTLRSHAPHGTFENTPWRRHFTRKQVSFDRMSENCSLDNEQYQNHTSRRKTVGRIAILRPCRLRHCGKRRTTASRVRVPKCASRDAKAPHGRSGGTLYTPERFGT